jgi:uncharacterized membrane protein YeaQ/YmgE (transglycosylase-associated protein family)
MAGGIEFAGSVLDTVSFFLVTPDLVGKERITRAQASIRKFLPIASYILDDPSSFWGGIVCGVIGMVLGLVFVALFGWSGFEAHSNMVIAFVVVGAPLAVTVLTFVVRAISAYSFNGILLAAGAVTFLVARGLNFYSSWPF